MSSTTLQRLKTTRPAKHVAQPAHVLILEASLTGHHSVYLERAVAAFVEQGSSVAVAVGEDYLQHAVVCKLSKKHGDALRLIGISRFEHERCTRAPFGDVGRELRFRRLFGDIYLQESSRRPIDYVFLPYLDYCLYAIGLLGSPFGDTEWGGICMRPSFHYRHCPVRAPRPKFAALKEALFHRVLKARGLTKLLSIDELLVSYFKQKRAPWAERLINLHDPAEISITSTQETARAQLGIPEDAVVVLVYGSIDERKGIDSLIYACAEVGAAHVLIVGRQDNWARDFLSSGSAAGLVASGRVFVLDEFVDEDRQQLCFAACDVVWLGYRNHYTMSGVLVLAAIAGKPVIATNEGLIGWHAAKLKLGRVCNTDRHAEVVDALGWAAESRNRHEDSPNRGALAELHSWRNFAAAVGPS